MPRSQYTSGKVYGREGGGGGRGGTVGFWILSMRSTVGGRRLTVGLGILSIRSTVERIAFHPQYISILWVAVHVPYWGRSETERGRVVSSCGTIGEQIIIFILLHILLLRAPLPWVSPRRSAATRTRSEFICIYLFFLFYGRRLPWHIDVLGKSWICRISVARNLRVSVCLCDQLALYLVQRIRCSVN